MKKRQDQPCSKFWALESGSCDSIHYDASPGGGGGGCASRKTLIFFPKFLLQSIFSLMTTTKKSPGTSPFYSFCRSGDHHFQNVCTCIKPFHRHPRPIYWGSWTQNVSSALRFTAGQSASHTLPTNQLQRPPNSCLSLLWSSTFARLSMLWSPAISCSTCSKAPIFHFAVAQTYHNLDQGPSPSTLMLAC